MIDSFSTKSRKEIVDMLNSLNWEKSWSLQRCPTANPHIWMKWVTFFGESQIKINLIRQWLGNLTHMQLVASTCIYNAFMDFNVAYYMACVVEVIPTKDHLKAIREFYDLYAMFDPSFDFKTFWKIFDCFRLYYGIHFKEDGGHLPKPVDE